MMCVIDDIIRYVKRKEGENMEGLVMPIEALLIICILTEAVVQIVKSALPRELSVTGINIIAMVVAILLCLALHVSIFTGETWIVYIGSVLAGLMASRGSNFTHDICEAIKNVKK